MADSLLVDTLKRIHLSFHLALSIFDMDKTSYDPDWHHSDEAGYIIHAIGLLSLEWNMTEHYMSMVISNFMPGGFASASVAMNMGNQTKTNSLVTLAKARKVSKIGMESIEHCCKMFNRLRDNRNILVHSHSISPLDGEKIEFRRANSRAPFYHVRSVTSLEEIQDNTAAIMVLGLQLVMLGTKTSPKRHIKKSGKPWPEKLPIPNKLTQLPFETSSKP